MALLRILACRRRRLSAVAIGALLPMLAVSPVRPVTASAAGYLTATTAQAAAGWTDIVVPLPAGADRTFAQLDSATCPTTTACTAVGSYTGSAGYQGLLLTGSGSAWTATQAPLPAGAAADPFVTITSVSCFSASVCAAIGTYVDSAGDTQALLLSGSGSAWTAAEAPLPAGLASGSVQLSGVACASVSTCVAVGAWSSSGKTGPVLITGFGTAWTAFKKRLPSPTYGGVLASVTCSGPSKCTAVGTLTAPDDFPEGLILTGFGSSWVLTLAPEPGGASQVSSLGPVQCPSSSHCVVAGAYGSGISGSFANGLLLAGRGRTWSATEASPLPDSTVPPGTQLDALACRTAAACVVVGDYWVNNGVYETRNGLIVTGSGSTWAATPAPLPGNASQNADVFLNGVACAFARSCVIADSYTTASGNQSSKLLRESGSSWSVIKTPIPGDAANSTISDVSCASEASACIGVGYYRGSRGNDRALLLTGRP